MIAIRLAPRAVLLLLAAFAAACTGSRPPGPPPPGDRARLAFTEAALLACPGSAFLPEPATVAVPDDGRAVSFGDGHSLAFEPGALPAGTRIRVTRPDAGHASLRFEVADSFRVFRAPARLTVNYASCRGAAGDGVDYNVYKQTRDGLFPAGGATAGKTVTTLLDGFSVYMIGGNRSAPAEDR